MSGVLATERMLCHTSFGYTSWPPSQDLTLLDLAATAEESGPAAAAARQALVFADEGGRSGWTPVGGFLLGEIRDATVLFAAAISPGAGGWCWRGWDLMETQSVYRILG